MTPDQGGAGEKTEKATPKKREDARKKGQVLKSAEVNTAVLTVVMFLVIFIAGGYIIKGMGELIVFYIELIGSPLSPPSQEMMHQEFTRGIISLTMTLLPFLGAALVMGVLVNIAQVGFLFTGEPLKPKFSKINPFEGFKRIFSLRSVVELVKAILKISLVGVVVYFEYTKHLGSFAGMMTIEIGKAGGILFDMCIGVAFKASMVLVGIGLADYLYQWYDFEKNLKMSKEEVKQEFKQMEGDPQIKSKRREKQRQMSMMRMMQDLPKADVVITNPTHYAVAIQYNDKESDAPVVLAKGKDLVAQKIKEAAASHGIEIVENKPVARALYAACDVGDKIPYDMFAAVAEVLAYVYQKKREKEIRTAGRNTYGAAYSVN